jgi:hypothetical protein
MARGNDMSAANAATGLKAAPPPKAEDPLRAALARSTAAKSPDRYKLRVRMFGRSAFADGGPNFDVEAYDEQGALADAVARQAAYDKALNAETRAPSLPAQRAARLKARLWPKGAS